MDLNLKNKKVLITGSTKGIGLEIARLFLKENSQVVLNGRSNKNLKISKKNLGNVKTIAGDVTNKKNAQKIANKFYKEIGDIDILICNVGSGRVNKKLHLLDGDWNISFKNNFFSTSNMIEVFKKREVVQRVLRTKFCQEF